MRLLGYLTVAFLYLQRQRLNYVQMELIDENEKVWLIDINKVLDDDGNELTFLASGYSNKLLIHFCLAFDVYYIKYPYSPPKNIKYFLSIDKSDLNNYVQHGFILGKCTLFIKGQRLRFRGFEIAREDDKRISQLVGKRYNSKYPDFWIKEKQFIFKFIESIENINDQLLVLTGFISHYTEVIAKMKNSFALTEFKQLIKEFKILRESLKLILPNKGQKKQSQNLFSGKKLNISDKYHIACKIFGIDTKLEQMGHLSATEKSVLLSQIMNCNQQTARELINGTQKNRTPIQHNIVDQYLKTLTNK